MRLYNIIYYSLSNRTFPGKKYALMVIYMRLEFLYKYVIRRITILLGALPGQPTCNGHAHLMSLSFVSLTAVW